MSGPYRAVDGKALRARRDARLRHLCGEIDELAQACHPVAQIYRRRLARMAGGLTGIAGAVALVIAVLAGRQALAAILAHTWVLVALAFLIARSGAPLLLAARLRRRFAPSADPGADLLAYDDASAVATAAREADRLERASAALPLVALCLLLPLTLHRLLGGFLGMTGLRAPITMDEWISLSVIVVGHCHLVLAGLAWSFARRLRGTAKGGVPFGAGWTAFAITTASSLPAAIVCLTVIRAFAYPAFLLVPVIVAVTGISFIPLTFAAIGRLILTERGALASVMIASRCDPSSLS